MSVKNCKVSVIIPALNEDRTIKEVIRDVKPFCDEIIVVDGHSKDQTVNIAAPDVVEWKRGEIGSYGIGLKNTDDLNKKTFYINVYLDNEDEIGVSNEEVKTWLTYRHSININPSSVDHLVLAIEPPSDAKLGRYLFIALVCTVELCDSTVSPDNEHGSKDFILKIV